MVSPVANVAIMIKSTPRETLCDRCHPSKPGLTWTHQGQQSAMATCVRVLLPLTVSVVRCLACVGLVSHTIFEDLEPHTHYCFQRSVCTTPSTGTEQRYKERMGHNGRTFSRFSDTQHITACACATCALVQSRVIQTCGAHADTCTMQRGTQSSDAGASCYGIADMLDPTRERTVLVCCPWFTASLGCSNFESKLTQHMLTVCHSRIKVITCHVGQSCVPSRGCASCESCNTHRSRALLGLCWCASLMCSCTCLAKQHELVMI